MEDIDMPPDVLELCDKDEMQKVINSHPGCENDEEPEGLPEQTRTSSETGPKIFSNVDMARIPNQFRRENWRELMPDLVDKIKSIKPQICGEKFYPYKFLSYGEI